MNDPLVTVAVPSLNQGRFLGDALESIFSQGLPVEAVVLDAGSTDESLSVIEQWAPHLLWWRSAPDAGQSAAINEGIARGNAPYVCWLNAAINEGIARGNAPYVCWLNADDVFLPGGLAALVSALEASIKTPAVYGRCCTVNETGKRLFPYLTMPFWPFLLASFCFVAQPATLVRRSAWESVSG
ncbi:MAG: glycosyltransferase, partial [Deltaproteobacteria bacterium]|nr:glycosyltransferase [Deltaproteobacteria bacterium]